MRTLIADMKTWRFWRHFSLKSFAFLGGLSTVLQTSSVINPASTVFQGPVVLVAVVVVSLLGGLWWSWPRPIAQIFSSPNMTISIVKGDMLNETSHLVVGTTDTFDTLLPHIISPKSLQGQVLNTLFGGDQKRLDNDIAAALANVQPVCTVAKSGKQDKYDIGTVAIVVHASRLIFFLAYCEMDLNNVASSTPDKVWKSFSLLWEEVSRRGNHQLLSVPVIGGGHARLSSVLPAQDAIRLTLLSFMFASREKKICDELRIVVLPKDYDRLDRMELQSFLSSLRAS
jgi:hypothetical protein